MQVPNGDKRGLVAEKQEHCFASNSLIRPGRTYHLTIESEVLCEGCVLSEAVIRTRDDPAAVSRDRQLIQRGKAGLEMSPGDTLHLVSALADAAIWPGGAESSRRIAFASDLRPPSEWSTPCLSL
jgi:hypothetical protein